MRRLGVIALVLFSVLTAQAGAATPATLKGRLTGAPLPAAGKGVASVRAVNLTQGVVSAADYTASGGTWLLRTPPGSYALVGTVVSFRGAAVIEKPLALVRARSGKTRSLRLSLKRKKHKRKKHHSHPRVTAAAGNVSVAYPAIWVHAFDVHSSNPDFSGLSKGLSQMMVTDLYTGIHGTPGCKAVIVERDRLADILNEQKLQQLPISDPGTRVQQGKLIKDNASVTGTLVENGGQVTLSATYTFNRTGKHGTVSVSGPAGSLLGLEQQLAQKVTDLVCSNAPAFYDGTVNGTVDHQTAGTESWQATDVRFAKEEGTPDDQPVYSIVRGTVHWEISGTDFSGCSWSGAATLQVTGFASEAFIRFSEGGYHGDSSYGRSAQATVTCPDGAGGSSSSVVQVQINPNWIRTGGDSDPPNPGVPGDELTGSASQSEGEATPHWTWSLKPADS